MAGPPGSSFRPRELEIVKVLLDKHLLERAINLAEARWEGSGEMVRLAYRWEELSPADRRQELERIGPEMLAHYRPLAELNPDLAMVLGTLEERGVLPGVSTVQPPAEPQLEATGPEPVPDSPSVYEAARQRLPHAVAEPVDDIAAELPPLSDMPADIRTRVERLSRETVIEAGAGFSAAETTRESSETEQRLRAEAVAQGEELLAKVRARLDSTSRQAASASTRISQAVQQFPVVEPRVTRSRSAPQQDAGTSIVEESPVPSLPPDYWAKRMRSEQIIMLEGGAEAPSDDQLVALANEFDLELSEFVIEPGSTRALFGGLKRFGSSVDVQVGPLPYALANPHLVVVRGRLLPSIEEGLQRGVCDIPGTRACVAIDERARLIVVS